MLRRDVLAPGFFLSAAILAPPLSAQSGPEPTSAGAMPGYVLQMEGQSSEPWRWRVDGGTDVFGVHGEEKSWAPDGSGEEVVEWELRMVDGPPVGGVPRTIEDDWGLLLPALPAPPAGLAGGGPVATDLGPIAYDSVRWDLRRGDRDEAIEGRATEHWILEVRSWAVQQPGTDSEMQAESNGRADLWFAPDLPFSAVPFVVARGSGFPLGVLDPAASRFALEQALPGLRERGLLLRADVSSSQARHVPGLDGPMTLGPDETRLRVSELRPGGADQPADGAGGIRLADYVMLDAARGAALTASGYLLSLCEAARSIAEGSRAEGSVAGAELRGGAIFQGGGAEPLRLVVATPESGPGPLACVVVLGPAGTEAGRLDALSPDLASLSAGAPPAGRAWATVAGGDAAAGTRSLLVVDEGVVALTAVGEDRIEGTVTLRGWRLSRTEGTENQAPTLEEDVEVEVSFTALPG